MKNIERRFMDVKEIRAADTESSMVIEGYPVVYDVEADLGWFKEIIRAGAATEALKRSDEFVLLNHDSNYPLARRSNGTLEVEEDEHGIKIKADVSGSARGRETHEMVKNELINKMSFAFTVEEDEWSKAADDEQEVREIISFKELYDYSPVTYPAYSQTEVQARSAEEVMKSREVSAEAEQSGAPDDGVDFDALLEPYYREIELIEGENL